MQRPERIRDVGTLGRGGSKHQMLAGNYFELIHCFEQKPVWPLEFDSGVLISHSSGARPLIGATLHLPKNTSRNAQNAKSSSYCHLALENMTGIIDDEQMKTKFEAAYYFKGGNLPQAWRAWRIKHKEDSCDICTSREVDCELHTNEAVIRCQNCVVNCRKCSKLARARDELIPKELEITKDEYKSLKYWYDCKRLKGGKKKTMAHNQSGQTADDSEENGPTSSQKQKHHASSQHTSTSVRTVDNEEEIDELDADDEVLGGDGMIIEETPAADLLACTTVHPLALPTLDSLALLQRQLEDITTDLRFQRKTNQDLCREYDSVIQRLREVRGQC
ncbi:hypothetical protein L218DRAFT_1005015 [Marasmius fiardii PR-910]|nr:hypothetical protein L218DRAFT_1005015 [Marasmius fiardii PR-910]